MRGRIPLLISIAISLAAGCAGTPPPRRGEASGGGAATEDFHQIAVAGVDGQSLALAAVLGGRPALLSFWAPWCEPCIKELPDLERLGQAMRPCGVGVVGVAVGEAPADIGAFTRARHLTFPQFTDREFRLADALGRRRIPTTIVFDGGGRVVFVGDALDQGALAALSRATAAAPGSVPCASGFDRVAATVK